MHMVPKIPRRASWEKDKTSMGVGRTVHPSDDTATAAPRIRTRRDN